MKSVLTLLSLLPLLLTATPASAQQIIVVPGCTGYCDEAPRCDPPPARVQPYNQPRALAPTVPAAPKALFRRVEPLRRWSLQASSIAGMDDYGEIQGGGVALSYMFSRHWGIQVGFFFLNSDTDYDLRTFTRSHVSALWYPSGIKNSGLNLYFKAGVMSQTIEESMAGDMQPYNNDHYYYDEPYYREESASSGSGTTIAVGGGLEWKIFSGYVSLGIEATLIAPMEDSDRGTTVPSSINLSFLSAVHF